MPAIAVLGCGWLGLPLAQSLIGKGFHVAGSTTAAAKLPVLEMAGIVPFQICLTEKGIEGDISHFLESAEILIIDIPPKLRGNGAENFVQKINNLIPFIEKSGVKKLLFIGSTSVFADNVLAVTEDSQPQPNTENGQQLFEAEESLRRNPNFQTTILRFGGLIGEDRNPVRFLSGKKGIENPDAPVNFIHQKDCIGLIQTIIEKEKWGEIFHGVSPQHPSRKNYYTQKAADLGLPLPEFDHEKPSVGKTVSGKKTQLVLGYEFQQDIV